MSDHIIIAPTYRYLSNPIISKLESELRDKYQISIVDFYETRSIFGSSGEIESNCKIHRFQNQHSMWNLATQRSLKKEMFDFLELSNPKWIITFSDVTVFSRLIRKSKFSARLVLIQPCLLDLTKHTFLKKIKLKIANVLNSVLPLPLFKEERSWGSNNRMGHQLIWSDVEAQAIQCSGRNYICGDYFVSSDYRLNENVKDDSKILVILPDLNFYTQSLRNEYEKKFLEMVGNLKNHEFSIKYHPLNEYRFDFSKNLNVVVLQSIDLEKLSKFSAVISCVSNLAIQFRKHHDKICIFDLMSFNVSDQKYFDEKFFYFSTNVQEIVKFILADSLTSPSYGSYRENYFKTEKCFEEFWGCITSNEPLPADADSGSFIGM